MKVWNVPSGEIHRIVGDVSSRLYNENLTFKRLPEEIGLALSFTLTVHKSSGPGARRGERGRRIAAACWHAHRDVMVAIFTEYPDARIKTHQADYRGAEDFVAKFEATGNVNIGSQMFPLYYVEACECIK